MRGASIVATVVVLALVAGLCPAVRGDETADASRHFKLGVSLHGEGKFTEALVEFERAYQLAPHPAVLYNIAATCRELSRYHESIRYFERFLAEGEGKAARALVERARKELAELRARVGMVTVTAGAAGVTVLVDGRQVGETPLPGPVAVGPGSHVFELRSPAGQAETRVVTVAAGDEVRLDVELAAKAPASGAVGGSPVTAVDTASTPAAPPSGAAAGSPAGSAALEPSRLPADPSGDQSGGSAPVASEQAAVRSGAGLAPRASGRSPRVGVSLAAATNALAAAETGAPVMGVTLPVGSHLSVGVDLVLVAFAVVPAARVRLLGERVSLHAVIAAPVSITDGGRADLFVAFAPGLGTRARVADNLAVRAEAMLSVAGGGHGVTLPVVLGAELWF